ncbi:DUF1772 domain-containing protein [Saccharopolyspora phatthalungensis]|uniref:DUF1772 domain-containing protein n=1 Tax=Saccharopolyspora phatthalungensis TaxID=664693 RepID=A0A840QD71_9PSEU|nr:DUF1772 domain-containing protein [Saccharopolyspora phatthalungensis]MBB5156499.1 hypothetical protein [Saccharopolyspora phatthalungensis]
MRRGVTFAALLLTALTMGLEFAHVLEWPQKQQYPGPLYVQLQESLYVWFGNLGGVLYVLAVVVTVVLAVLTRRWPIAVAAGAQVIALASFLTIVYPVNLRLPVGSGGSVPSDWMALRDRWELGHAVGFALFTISFVLLVITLQRREAPVRPAAR